MPCQDDYGDPEKDARTISAQRIAMDTMASMLCELCEDLELVDRKEHILRVPGLKAWWIEHKRRDAEEAERKHVEDLARAAEEHKKQLVRQAIKKLTRQEREALGLRI